MLAGASVSLVPLSLEEHGEDLWAGAGGLENESLWAFMTYGPFRDRAEYLAHVETQARSDDPIFYAVLDRATGRAVGSLSLMRMVPKHRVIEVGHILYTHALQKTRAATEAMYLLARYVFEDLRYRRYEWKCDARNIPSRTAALRFGFSFEGIFRQHMIVKGRNRDTAWFSMLDSEWPARKAAFERWLHPDNFDPDGRQRSLLNQEFRTGYVG